MSLNNSPGVITTGTLPMKASSTRGTTSTCPQRLCLPHRNRRGLNQLGHDPLLDPDQRPQNCLKIVKLTDGLPQLVVTRREMLELVPIPTWNSEEDMDVAALLHPIKDCHTFEEIKINFLVP